MPSIFKSAAAGCSALILAALGYGAVVYHQASNIDVNNLDPQLVASGGSFHQDLVLATSVRRQYGHWLFLTDVSVGYDKSLLPRPVDSDAGRRAFSFSSQCSEVGKPPLLTESAVSGAFPLFERHLDAASTMPIGKLPDDATDALKSGGTFSVYYSVDGGETGKTLRYSGAFVPWRTVQLRTAGSYKASPMVCEHIAPAKAREAFVSASAFFDGSSPERGARRYFEQGNPQALEAKFEQLSRHIESVTGAHAWTGLSVNKGHADLTSPALVVRLGHYLSADSGALTLVLATAPDGTAKLALSSDFD